MRALLFANGQLQPPAALPRLRHPGDLILCADGGAVHALALGLRPDIVIGDLDSLDPHHRQQLQRLGCQIEQHPTDKDATDLELALLAAQRLGVDDLVLLAVLGGRLDQELANLLLLAHPQFANLRLRLIAGEQTAWIVRDHITIDGQPGDTVSALALSPQVEGLTYHHGLRWPLHDFTLPFGSTRGVSNELTAPSAHISLRHGVLLAIHIPASIQEHLR